MVVADPRVAEAERRQVKLRKQLDLTDRVQGVPATVVGLDVSYDAGTRRAAAAVVVIEVASLEVKETAISVGAVSFPYIPGLLAFREVPILLEALAKLASRLEVLVCDGYGIAHPARFGLACHVGVVTGVPAFGVAKTPFVAKYSEPGMERGAWSDLTHAGDVVGRVVRTQTGVKPVFVSVGHRIGLDQATALTLKLSGRYRMPESTRMADSQSRRALRV